MTLTTKYERDHYRDQAFYLGADAGASVAVVLSDTEAAQLASHGAAPSDIVRRPDLSGEWADDLTADSLVDSLHVWGDTEAERDDRASLRDELAQVYEEGVDATFGDHVRSMAYRTVGRVDRALNVERMVDDLVTRLRRSAESSKYHADHVATMRTQVEAGAELLDTYAADTGAIPNRWRELVDIVALNMESATRCVLGQVWGKSQGSDLAEDERPDYHDACNDLHLVTDNVRAHKGFLHDLGDEAGAVTLKELWTEYLG